MGRLDRLETTVGPDQIVLAAGGAGWMGTYAVLVTALFADVLLDGESVQAYIEYHDGDRYKLGRVSAVDETTVTFDDESTVSIEDITLVRI